MLGDEKPIEGRPADYLQPMLEKIKKELPSELVEKEDYLTYALFPDEALEFFKYRKKMREKALSEFKVKVYDKIMDARISRDGENRYTIYVQGKPLIVDIVEY